MGGKDDLDQPGFGGSAGVPTPRQLVQPSLWNDLLQPDFKEPDFSKPTLKKGYLAAADVNFVPEFAPDPTQPDLQHPDLKQQSTMAPDERPGDLDPMALDVMHASAQYRQIRDKQYPAVQMDQSGMNNHRSRNFTNLMKGLEELQ